MILSQRDVDILKLLCWCQFIQPRDLRGLATEAERKNLMGLGATLPRSRVRARLRLLDGMILRNAERKLRANLDREVKNSTAYTMATTDPPYSCRYMNLQ